MMQQPNAQMQAVLDELQVLGGKPIETLTPDEARRQPSPADAVGSLLMRRGLDPSPVPLANVDDRLIPGPIGDFRVRVYTPEGAGPFPVLLYMHGGGWVIATIDTYDASCRALANAVPCIVVSVNYRQAPEHPFPAAVDDVHAAYHWVLANAAEFGGDPTRIAVAGESAGGNLATVLTLLAREHGDPLPLHQLLVYPVTDFNDDKPSYWENADAKPLNRAMMQWFKVHYLPNAADAGDPRAAPLGAADLSGLPPATIILAEIDPLRSDGEQYLERLRAAGVPTRATVFKGVTHEFFGMTAVLDAAKDAVAEAADELRASFGISPTTGVVGSQRSADMTGGIPVQIGDTVIGSDAALVGRIKEVRAEDVLVDRSLQRDVYVPLAAIVDITAGQVTLTITAERVNDMDWPNP